MAGATDVGARAFPGRLAVLGASLGVAGGLVEGVGHMALQRLDVLENSWFDIIWIAALFNGALVTAVALLAGLLVMAAPGVRWLRGIAIFVVCSAAVLPVLALLLKEWLEPYAIASLTLGVGAALTRRYAGSRSTRLPTTARPAVAMIVLALTVMATLVVGARLREAWLLNALPDAPPDAPSILLVVIDTLRSDHVSAYGYARNTTPFLDTLAAEGTLFTRAYSTSSYTLPAHASLLTGLYPREHRVRWQTSKVQATADYPTLAETLQARGFRTAAFSANTFWFTREHGFGRGFIHFDDFFYSVPDMWLRTAYGRIATRLLLGRFGWNDIPARRRATGLNHDVLKWIGDRDDAPFFAVVNYMDVHDPYRPPEPYRSRFSSQPSPGGRINWLTHVPDELSDAELQAEIDAYDGGIAYVDDAVADLVGTLRERTADRGLMVVVVSDHGEEFGEHGGLLHANHLYREVVQVPLIIWEPGHVPAGHRMDVPVSITSVPATVLARLGVDAPAYRAPLQALWRDDSTPAADWPPPRASLAHRPWAAERSRVRTGSLRSIVDGDLHLIEHSVDGVELYDLGNDPAERQNLAGRPALSEVVVGLRRRLADGPRPPGVR